MIICISSETRLQLQPRLACLDSIEADFDTINDLRRYLQTRLQQPINTPIPILLDFDCLTAVDANQQVSELSRLYVLSNHKLVVLGTPAQLDTLSEESLHHLHAVLSLPLGQTALQMLIQNLDAAANRRRQIDAHEQRIVQLMEENRRLRVRLQHESLRDPGTGLYHRRGFEERLDKEWRRAHRYGHPLSGLAIQIQGLEQVPDTAAFLEDLIRRFRAVRASDCVTQLETEQFVLLMPETHSEGAESLKQHFYDMITRLIKSHNLSAVQTKLSTITQIPRRHGDSPLFLKQLLSEHAMSSDAALVQ